MSYNVVAETPYNTVVAEYEPSKQRADSYQSEAALEAAFIKQLQSQGYEFLPIHNEKELVANLRQQIEALNKQPFSDKEWEKFFRQYLGNPQQSVADKADLVQAQGVVSMRGDDGALRNVVLFDKKNIHNNRLQVINQYEEEGGHHKTRYDVTILLNGLPMVHVELKRRGVAIKEAFNQVKRYQRDSFWAGSGLFEFVEIFVISNGTHTRYYSNTTRESHIKEVSNVRGSSKKTSNSFEFTCCWADAKNKRINDLVDFTATFFSKHTLLNVLARFCVFTSERLLLVMRPYQITATERILERIVIADNQKWVGDIRGGGYIWHTTGSGKTLTSFKTAQLATALPSVDKVLFVVDRKDLDYQTIKEYDRFKKGAANGNNSVKVLAEQLGDDSARIIITTIQKLDIFIKKYPKHPVYAKHVVIVFDECHRSQFGDMHTSIVKAFKKYNIFGFTGTPIFAKNSKSGKNPTMKTTEQVFGDKLHVYTIVDAINDGNVLPFRIDYIKTSRVLPNMKDEPVKGIDTEAVLRAPKRIEGVVGYVLEHFDQKTKRSNSYEFRGNRVFGFNSIFTTTSIPSAMQYYREFKKQNEEAGSRLKIALIYSYSPNADDPDEDFSTEGLDRSSRDFLESAIADYNAAFHTNFDTSDSKFQNYYKDLSQRMKNREIDILIVVDMFLTGFDATTLNTLWVDKRLQYHGLIQAFSRTNRILNSVKTFGNIVCFRDLQKETDEAIALFGNAEASGIILLRTCREYYEGYMEESPEGGGRKFVPGYLTLIEDLEEKFPLDEPIVGDKAKKEFVALWGKILRLRNILDTFDDFTGHEILTEREYQDYQSKYLDIWHEIRGTGGHKENVNDDIIFEIELVRQVEINIDYILMLVEKYRSGSCEDKTLLSDIDSAIGSSTQLRSKKELIEGFLKTINPDSQVEEGWRNYVLERKEADLEELITSQKLRPQEARDYLERAFRDGELQTIGAEFNDIMPRHSLFAKDTAEKREGILDKIKAFFEKYIGLSF